MTESVLIIGYGRAGERHAKMAKEMGLETFAHDPFVFPHHAYDLMVSFLDEGLANSMVIATPPDSHLRYIRLALDYNLPVLCEKPLCALGQLAEARVLLDHPNAHKAMIAYNWRYHPRLGQAQKSFSSGLFLDCWQHRDNLPEWGLLLDHCSHDLDILRFVSTNEPEILSANYWEGKTLKTWTIKTTQGGIRESVTDYATKRYANFYFAPGRFIELDPDPKMYTGMWQAFLRGDYRPGLDEAIKTQELLEKCYQLNGEKSKHD